MCGWLAALISAGFFGYSGYAVATGAIELSARFSHSTLVFNKTPGPFLFALFLYILGGVVFIWVAKGLLVDHPRWYRDRNNGGR